MLSTACKTQPDHPNQLNAFDGATYNSLTLAHAALSSFRDQISSGLPQYAPAFNEAATAYEDAFSAYATYRSQPQQNLVVVSAITELTRTLLNLENGLISGAHADSQAVASVRGKALRLRSRAGRNITISDILTELEIAASVAETIPATGPYSKIASMVIEATNQALAAQEAAAGQPIDLSTIQPLPPIQ